MAAETTSARAKRSCHGHPCTRIRRRNPTKKKKRNSNKKVRSRFTRKKKFGSRHAVKPQTKIYRNIKHGNHAEARPLSNKKPSLEKLSCFLLRYISSTTINRDYEYHHQSHHQPGPPLPFIPLVDARHYCRTNNSTRPNITLDEYPSTNTAFQVHQAIKRNGRQLRATNCSWQQARHTQGRNPSCPRFPTYRTFRKRTAVGGCLRAKSS